MSKKTIKKNIELNRKKEKESIKKDPRKNAMNAIKIIVGLLVFVVLTYMVAALISGEYKLDKPKNEIDTSVILAGNTFSQKSSDYYVLFYDFNDTIKDEIESLITSNDANYFFKVNISDGMNSKYVDLVSNSEATEASQLHISDTTMIHIKDGKNIQYVEGIDDIKSNFN